ncbi:MAG: ribosomal subunit interface protein [Candidatus Doudnabacteria bacterium RIFCSPHIGHO2_01_52_17]|uniref:Ribosomal subunit interface protein n=1 Tax=Candidatus Doudnabacteria bacterium RIFCSPHIGHO2_01_52_17 TaxID=1817820 RepID=A0A1F5NAG7_9BACT|nr:MAG: ribosomal subunit interface protein [Candidatus Doudnabacteria bacterium RIFCSPHIGHO2_01_52_17]
MKIVIKGTNLQLTDAIKAYAEEKVGHLEHFWDEILEARVELEQSQHHRSGFFRCEINLDVPEKHVMRAESEGPDLYAAIDAAVPKLHEQIEKFKGQRRSTDREYRRYLKSFFAWRPWGNKK